MITIPAMKKLVFFVYSCAIFLTVYEVLHVASSLETNYQSLG